MLRYLILFSLLYITPHVLCSQSVLYEDDIVTECENVYIKTSKNIYEPGEDLWFRAFVLNSHNYIPSNLSRVFFLELIKDGATKAIWQEKYTLLGGCSYGHVYVPDTLSCGLYSLIGYTKYSSCLKNVKQVTRIKVQDFGRDEMAIYSEFNKDVYEAGDTLKLSINVERDGNKLAGAEVDTKEFKVRLLNAKTETDDNGRVELVFVDLDYHRDTVITLDIKYGDLKKKEIITIPTKTCKKFDFKLYPEGGVLLYDVPNIVAFEALDENKHPQSVVGNLYENDSCIKVIKTIHNGMGLFGFIPKENRKYYVKIDGGSEVFHLADIKQQGMNLHLIRTTDSLLYFNVYNTAKTEEGSFYIRGRFNGKTCFLARGANKETSLIKIPLKGFPNQGVAEFTLFTEDLKPVAERLVYVNMNKKLNIQATSSKKKYSTREKVDLKLKVTDEKGVPVESDLVVSVYDKLYNSVEESSHIDAHYFINSNFNEGIYNPYTYINDTSERKGQFLDLLMLVKGWRKYIWQEDNLNRNQVLFDEVVEGQVISKKISVNTPLVVFNAVSKKKQILITDEEGRFYLPLSELKEYKGKHNYIKPSTASSSKNKVEFLDPFDVINSARFKNDFIWPLVVKDDTLKSSESKKYMGGTNFIMLEDVVIEGKSKGIRRDKYLGYLDSLTNYELSGIDYVAIHCNTLNCPIDSHQGDGHKKPINGETYNVHLDKAGNAIGIYYPYEYWFGDRGKVYTLPQLSEEELLKMNNLWRFDGYYSNREFYHHIPNKDSISMYEPDFRNTLAWFPSIKTDKKGEAQLEFYCSDINTQFLIEIDGVSEQGLLGSQSTTIDVRKTAPYLWEFK